MEKTIKLELSEIPFEKYRHNGIEYLVSPYISLENKLQIIQSYVDALFAEGDAVRNLVTAEYALMLSVTDLCTNIDIGIEDIVNKLVFTGFWDEIRSHILNYEEFRDELDAVVGMKYDEMSISSSLNALIAKASAFLDNLSKLDLSENGIKALVEAYGDLEKNVNGLKNTFGETNAAEKRKRGRPKKNVQQL
jgi:hypothetical protein